MSIDLSVSCECDECGTSLDDGDGVVCQSCFDDVKTEKEDLEDKVSELEDIESERDDLQQDVERLEGELTQMDIKVKNLMEQVEKLKKKRAVK